MPDPTVDRPADVRSFAELRDTGLLWLINTAVLHPRGYAISLHYPYLEATEPNGWTIEGDGSEPWTFGDDCDEQFQAVARLLAPPSDTDPPGDEHPGSRP